MGLIRLCYSSDAGDCGLHDLRRCSGSGVVGTGGVGKPEGAGSRMGTDPWRKSKKRAMFFFHEMLGILG